MEDNHTHSKEDRVNFCNKLCTKRDHCPLKNFNAELEYDVCPYLPNALADAKRKLALKYLKDQVEKGIQKALRMLKEENFNVKYCQRCDLRNTCALMQVDEKMRQRFCVYDIPYTKVKADIDPSLLKPLTQSQLN